MQTSRISQWASDLANVAIDNESESLFNEVQEILKPIPKDEILKKLIRLQLNQLTSQSEEDINLNETVGKSTSESSGRFRKFFINVGSVDGFIKEDMVHLLADLSGVERKNFGKVKLLKNRSYFEVDKSYEKGFEKKFDGVEFEGRAVRVHVDNDAYGDRSESGSYNKKKGNRRSGARRDNRKSNRRRRGK